MKKGRKQLRIEESEMKGTMKSLKKNRRKQEMKKKEGWKEDN